MLASEELRVLALEADVFVLLTEDALDGELTELTEDEELLEELLREALLTEEELTAAGNTHFLLRFRSRLNCTWVFTMVLFQSM